MAIHEPRQVRQEAARDNGDAAKCDADVVDVGEALLPSDAASGDDAGDLCGRVERGEGAERVIQVAGDGEDNVVELELVEYAGLDDGWADDVLSPVCVSVILVPADHDGHVVETVGLTMALSVNFCRRML